MISGSLKVGAFPLHHAIMYPTLAAHHVTHSHVSHAFVCTHVHTVHVNLADCQRRLHVVKMTGVK